jgi:UDP-glucose 4-epimerase
MKLNYQLTSAREGDVVEIYANNEKARQYLGWEPFFTIEEMMKTAWDWEMSNKPVEV